MRQRERRSWKEGQPCHRDRTLALCWNGWSGVAANLEIGALTGRCLSSGARACVQYVSVRALHACVNFYECVCEIVLTCMRVRRRRGGGTRYRLRPITKSAYKRPRSEASNTDDGASRITGRAGFHLHVFRVGQEVDEVRENADHLAPEPRLLSVRDRRQPCAIRSFQPSNAPQPLFSGLGAAVQALQLRRRAVEARSSPFGRAQQLTEIGNPWGRFYFVPE